MTLVLQKEGPLKIRVDKNKGQSKKAHLRWHWVRLFLERREPDVLGLERNPAQCPLSARFVLELYAVGSNGDEHKSGLEREPKFCSFYGLTTVKRTYYQPYMSRLVARNTQILMASESHSEIEDWLDVFRDILWPAIVPTGEVWGCKSILASILDSKCSERLEISGRLWIQTDRSDFSIRLIDSIDESKVLRIQASDVINIDFVDPLTLQETVDSGRVLEFEFSRPSESSKKTKKTKLCLFSKESDDIFRNVRDLTVEQRSSISNSQQPKMRCFKSKSQPVRTFKKVKSAQDQETTEGTKTKFGFFNIFRKSLPSLVVTPAKNDQSPSSSPELQHHDGSLFKWVNQERGRKRSTNSETSSKRHSPRELPSAAELDRLEADRLLEQKLSRGWCAKTPETSRNTESGLKFTFDKCPTTGQAVSRTLNYQVPLSSPSSVRQTVDGSNGPHYKIPSMCLSPKPANLAQNGSRSPMQNYHTPRKVLERNCSNETDKTESSGDSPSIDPRDNYHKLSSVSNSPSDEVHPYPLKYVNNSKSADYHTLSSAHSPNENFHTVNSTKNYKTPMNTPRLPVRNYTDGYDRLSSVNSPPMVSPRLKRNVPSNGYSVLSPSYAQPISFNNFDTHV